MTDNTAEDFFYTLCSESVFEKLHLKTCKNFLGVNRRSTNLAVIGETGHYPLMFDIVVTMLKYYKRLCYSDLLLVNAFRETSVAHERNKLPWIGCVKTISTFLNADIFS